MALKKEYNAFVPWMRDHIRHIVVEHLHMATISEHRIEDIEVRFEFFGASDIVAPLNLMFRVEANVEDHLGPSRQGGAIGFTQAVMDSIQTRFPDWESSVRLRIGSALLVEDRSREPDAVPPPFAVMGLLEELEKERLIGSQSENPDESIDPKDQIG